MSITFDLPVHTNHTTTGLSVAPVLFGYDPVGDGNRVKKDEDGIVTLYPGRHYEFTKDSGSTKYYYADGQLVSFERSPDYGQDIGRRFVFRDHLGSTSVIVNGRGEKLWEDRYLPFGDVRYTYRKEQEPGLDIVLQTQFRYTSQWFEDGLGATSPVNVDGADVDRGLYYYGARWYDSSLGRFIQPDTIVPEPGNPQSLNRYSYAANNALRYTDPSGHAVCVDVDCAWIVHPVSGEIRQRRPTIYPPEQPGVYDPAESYQRAMGLVEEFRGNMGPFEREFGPTSFLTQDIMYGSGSQEFHQVWAEAGYPLPFTWRHHVDIREGGSYPVRFVRSLPGYIGAQVKMVLTGAGLGSKTPEGPIDAVDGTIGSLDTIRLESVGSGWIKIEVKNRMNWESGLRIPGGDKSLNPLQVPGIDMTIGDVVENIFGGAHGTEQTFYWWEPISGSH